MQPHSPQGPLDKPAAVACQKAKWQSTNTCTYVFFSHLLPTFDDISVLSNLCFRKNIVFKSGEKTKQIVLQVIVLE